MAARHHYSQSYIQSAINTQIPSQIGPSKDPTFSTLVQIPVDEMTPWLPTHYSKKQEGGLLLQRNLK